MTQWEECPAPRTPESGDREFREDFDTESHEVDGASIDLRPDAISVDHHTAFTLGPVELADPSEGLLARVWRAQVESDTVMVCSAWMNNGGWNEPVPLFHVDDGLGPLTEIDFAFEQTGNPVVCAERPTGPDGSSEVWVYFYDATIPGPVFRNFGPGRTPRALLDRPLEIGDSDVCVFYVDDSLGRIAYRQQRDRYEEALTTPAMADENTFIEDVAKREDRRVVVLYSRRDRETGRYTLHQLTSTLMPIIADIDSVTADASIQQVQLDRLILDALAGTEALTASASLQSVEVREPVIVVELSLGAFTAGASMLSVELVDLVIRRSIETEALTAGASLDSVAVDLVITIDVVIEEEALTAGASLQSVILEAA